MGMSTSIGQDPKRDGHDGTAGESPRGTSLIELANGLLRHPRIMVWLPLAIMVAALLAGWRRGMEYTAESQFEPRSAGSGTMQVAGLAAQFGINVGAGTGVEPIDFYARVLQSKDLLREAAFSQYTFSDRHLGEPSGDSLSGTFAELMKVEGKTDEQRAAAAVRALDARVSTRVDLRAGLVVLSTTAPWPELAVQVNRRMLDLLNTFNLEKRQSQAAAERQFVGDRLAEVEKSYEQAEADLLVFYQRNRLFQDDPELRLEAERLQRQVSHQQQVFTTLRQAYEQARIDEVRDTPVLTIVEPPEASVERTGGLVLYGMLGLVLGGLLAVGVALLAEHLGGERDSSPEVFREFTRLRREAFRKLLPARSRGSTGNR